MSNVLKAFAGSRKFWLAIAALIVCTVFVALGKIESSEFLTMVLAIFGGLATLIGVEDAAAKNGAGRNVTVNAPSAPTVITDKPPTDPGASS